MLAAMRYRLDENDGNEDGKRHVSGDRRDRIMYTNIYDVYVYHVTRILKPNTNINMRSDI